MEIYVITASKPLKFDFWRENSNCSNRPNSNLNFKIKLKGACRGNDLHFHNLHIHTELLRYMAAATSSLKCDFGAKIQTAFRPT